MLVGLCIDRLCKNEFPMGMCEWKDSLLYFKDYFRECLSLRFYSKCHILKWYFFLYKHYNTAFYISHSGF